MAKKREDRLAFDPITNELLPDGVIPSHYVWVWDENDGRTSTLVPNDGYEGLSVIWRENDPFHARLKLTQIGRTYSGSAVVELLDVDTNMEYSMYAAEFNVIVDRFGDGGILCGLWKYKRKGGSYVLQGVE